MAKLYRRNVRRLVKRHVREVSAQQVADAYRLSMLRNLQLQLFDSRYLALPAEVWQTVLDYTQIDKKPYKSEHYDCDNFAMALCGQVPTFFDVNGVGLVADFSGGHAYNALIVYEGVSLEIVAVEPQSDQWGVVKQGGRMYAAMTGYTIFS